MIEEIRTKRKERAEQKAKKLIEWAVKNEARAAETRKELDKYDMQFWTEPIKIGHHSQTRHTNLRNRLSRKMDKAQEFLGKAREQRQKAENILFYQTRVKGDAERTRQSKREELDTIITVGAKVHDPVFGVGTVQKVNKKTYTIEFESGWITTRDKTYVKSLKE